MQRLVDITNFITTIPATFWGVVAGSFFSLGGVALTNRASNKRLIAQFAHERTARTADREFALRQKIYLDAIEAAFAGMACLSKFVDPDTKDSEIMRPYVEKGPAIARTQIIANESTARAITALTTELNSAVFKLSTRRIRLTVLKEQINATDNLIQRFEKNRDEMLALMTQYNLEGRQDPKRWQTIDGNFQFERKRIDEHIEQKKRLMLTRANLQLEMTSEVFDQLAGLQLAAVSTVLAIRDELELPIDGDTYRNMIEENLQRQREEAASFVAVLQNIIQQASGDSVAKQ